MTFATSSDLQVIQLRRELARSDERLKVIDREVQRIAVMVDKLYELRYHQAPAPVKRPAWLDEDGQ